MNIVGRITKDAVVNQLPDERKVVSFSLALNDYSKSKNGEVQQFTTYVECAYWRNQKIAERLTKGTLVEITGRLYTRAFISKDGSAKATLHCHVSSIKIHATGHQQAVTPGANQPSKAVEEYSDEVQF